MKTSGRRKTLYHLNSPYTGALFPCCNGQDPLTHGQLLRGYNGCSQPRHPSLELHLVPILLPINANI